LTLLAYHEVEVHHGARAVLRGVTGVIGAGEKLALVGRNGSGKTTMLRLAAGLVEPDLGEVRRGRRTRIGYLPQHPEPPAGLTVTEWVLQAFGEIKAIEDRLTELHVAMGDATGDEQARLLEELGELEAEHERRGGWGWERRAEAVMDGLGLDAELRGRVAETLSGGETSRAALAKLLCEEPDVLLLDEPTNHLDLKMLEWLEGFLAQAPEAVLIVSHDRAFLDAVVSGVLALEHGKLTRYEGNYTRYKQLRREQLERREKERLEIADYVEKERAFIRRFRAGQRAKEARGRERRLERYIEEHGDGRVRETEDLGTFGFRFASGKRKGGPIFRITDLAAGYDPGAPLFQGLDLEVLAGEVVGIVGPNGAGKTTLLRVLHREMEPLGGEVKTPPHLRISVFYQQGEDLDLERTALDQTHDAAPREDLVRVRALLGRLGLSGDEQLKPVGAMSGGERARVSMARLLITKPQVLLLDEPTNHLDTAAREALEVALAEFDGTIIAVSHDRYFLDRLADRVLAFSREGCPRAFHGGYTDFRRAIAAAGNGGDATSAAAADTAGRSKGGSRQAKPAKPAKPAKQGAASKAKRGDGRKRRPKRKHSFEELEKKIIEHEEAIAQLERDMADPTNARDHEQLRKLGLQHERARAALAELNAEWEVWAEDLG
jgi:ATP-binding cassette subfamily F protein 3